MELALGTREGSSVRGGPLGGLRRRLTDAAVDKAVDAAVAPSPPGAVSRWRPRRPAAHWRRGRLRRARRVRRDGHRPDGVLAQAARLVLAQLGLDNRSRRPGQPRHRIDRPGHRRTRRRLAPPGGAGVRRRRAVLLDDRWASAREDLVTVWLADEGDIDADWDRLSQRFEGRPRGGHPGRLVAGSSLAEGRTGTRLALRAHRRRRREPAPDATPTRSPSSPVRRSSIAASVVARCSTAGRRSSPPPHGWMTSVWRSTRGSTATTPGSARRCGWFRPIWPLTPISTR